MVDISNYVLLEYGQPLHMFDQEQIGSQSIEVRQAKKDETMRTLDGEERRLLDTDIVITNGKDPIALEVLWEEISLKSLNKHDML